MMVLSGDGKVSRMDRPVSIRNGPILFIDRNISHSGRSVTYWEKSQKQTVIFHRSTATNLLCNDSEQISLKNIRTLQNIFRWKYDNDESTIPLFPLGSA
jgi:hypothetical protein